MSDEEAAAAAAEDEYDQIWINKGKAAYDDGQPLHAAPSGKRENTCWLIGWQSRHAESKKETGEVIIGVPVRLKQYKGKIRLTLDDGTVIGEQKYVELENDLATLNWTARVTFTDLKLDIVEE